MLPQDIHLQILPSSFLLQVSSCDEKNWVHFLLYQLPCSLLSTRLPVGVWDASSSLQGLLPSPGMQAEILPVQETMLISFKLCKCSSSYAVGKNGECHLCHWSFCDSWVTGISQGHQAVNNKEVVERLGFNFIFKRFSLWLPREKYSRSPNS